MSILSNIEAKKRMKELPNILTISRIILIPLILVAFYTCSSYGIWIAAALFSIASITDYFDGALARSLNAYSSFGKILDPIADKLLVASTLMMLTYFNKAPLIPSILILCREIIVSGLREYLSEFKLNIPVSKLAKVKTFVQFLALLTLILSHEALKIPVMYYFGYVLLWLAAILTIVTGYAYMKEGLSKV